MSGQLPLVGSEAEIKAVPILDMQEDGQGFEPIFDVFEEIFDNVRDFPVAIISIAGPFRKGKSFLLNLLAHYLMENQSSTWFKMGDTHPARVFEWKGGVERNTVGIHITNKPFMLETSDNKKVAVFLMDTQGMFDTKTTAKDCSTIFALSTLLSSVQIYNLTEQIHENDLQQFEIFTKYAKYAAEEKQHVNSSTTPFQSLMLLIRNWEKADFKSSFKGGAKYLETVMKPNIQENKSVRQNIRTSFSEVACFPMEHPGKKVAKRKESDDSGVPLKDMDDDFLQQVDEVARYLFSPDRLVIKRLNGKVVTGEQFIDLAIEYSKILSSGKMPKVEALHVASEKAEKFKQIKQIEVESIAAMEIKVGGKYIDPKKLEQLQSEHLAAALKKYDENVGEVFDDDENKTNREKMEDVFRLANLRISEKNNKHKDSVKVEICKRAADAAQDYKDQLLKKHLSASNEEDMAIYKSEFRKSRSSFLQWANQTFDVSVVGECTDAIQNKFLRNFEEFESEQLKHQVETRNGVLKLRTCLAETYFTIMTENKETYLDEPKLEKIHLATKKAILNAYGRRVKPSFKEYKQHMDGLTEDIADLFKKVKDINRNSKISEELDKFCKILATEYLNMICRVMSKRYVDCAMVTEKHGMFTYAIKLEIENVVENKNVREQCVVLSEKTLNAKFDEVKARSSLWNRDGSPAHSVGVFGKIGKKLGLFTGKSPTKLMDLVKDLKSIAHLKALRLGGE